jgi:Fe-S-cluster-containing hydrogenase component 2
MEVDEKLCVGCRMCTMACPFGLIVIGLNQKAIKCDLCGGDPECVKACTYGALEFTADETRALERRNVVFQYLKKSSFYFGLPPGDITLSTIEHK